MNKRLTQLSTLLNKQLGLFLSISFGVFLFVLFFQPFPLDHLDFNNKLLFVSGLGAITFLLMIICRFFFPWIFEDYDQYGRELLFQYLNGFILLASNSLAIAFYLHFVGYVGISFYVVFKVILISLAPPVVLSVYDAFSELGLQNISLLDANRTLQKNIEKYEEDYLCKSVEFVSYNNNEYLSLLIADIAFLKSADNYVEIVYMEENKFRKKLIRNALKNAEQQLKPYNNFLRCHRICIVNTHYIEKLTSKYNNHYIIIKGYPDLIPVSRQYLLKIQEVS